MTWKPVWVTELDFVSEKETRTRGWLRFCRTGAHLCGGWAWDLLNPSRVSFPLDAPRLEKPLESAGVRNLLPPNPP